MEIRGIVDREGPAGYWAVRKAAGWRDLPNRSKIEVSGPDAITFLHAMISNDVTGLPVFHGRYGTFLSATGKILADFHYYRLEDTILLDIATELADSFRSRLEEFIIMDDVQLREVSGQFRHISIQGPKSSALLHSMTGADLPADEHEMAHVQRQGGATFLIRRAELADEGFEMIADAGIAEELLSELLRKGIPVGLEEVSREAFEILRLERGIPLYGIDMSEKNNPLEPRISSAYSLTKGCYPGQEVVAKATNIGGVARLLTCLKLHDERVPVPGSSVRESAGQEVGWVTSAALSPAVGSGIALAYLKRAVAVPGRMLKVPVADGENVSAETVESFL